MILKKYVVGFLFSPDGKRVALIRKNKPPKQAGKFNGIGGSVENGESFSAAMVREFKEETGVHITDWDLFAIYTGTPGYVVHFYKSTVPGIDQVKTMEAEIVSTHDVINIAAIPKSRIMHNLKWLIPMALDDDITSIVEMRGM